MTKRLLIAVLLVGLLGATGTAFADTVLTTSSTSYVGLINDGIPSDLGSSLGYLNTLLGLPSPSGPTLIGSETYTRSANAGPFPLAIATGATKTDTNDNTGIDVTGFEYILGKYDAGNAGTLVWYVGNISGLVDIPLTFNGQQYELSHFALFNANGTPPPRLPEPASLLLLGFGMTGVATFMRRRK